MEELPGKCSYAPKMPGEQVQSRYEMDENHGQCMEIYQLLRDETPIGLTEDLLKWWQENDTLLSHVRNLALRVLAAPPMSVPSSEQIFKPDWSFARSVPRLNQSLLMHFCF